jgi:hypothetical protein
LDESKFGAESLIAVSLTEINLIQVSPIKSSLREREKV